MAQIGSVWAPTSWVSVGGWASGTWANVASHTGNRVVPNTVADLGQLFKKTVYHDPLPLGPTLHDLERQRRFTAQKDADHAEWMAVLSIALDMMGDDE